MSGRRSFTDKYGPWAVVTGASDGIGREVAVALAERGVNLVAVARREGALQVLARELADRHGVTVIPLPADLAQPGSVDTVIRAVTGLDIGLLVAAAGFGTSGPFLATGLEQELSMIDVNCRAVAEMCHRVVPLLLRRGRGGIVLMGSLVGFQGVARAANYAATKAFVQTLAEGLNIELRPLGIDVLSSAPGPVRSGFDKRADMRMGFAADPRTVALGTLAALGRRTTVRPGLLSKLLEISLALLPRWGRSRIMSVVMQTMTRHQDGVPAP